MDFQLLTIGRPVVSILARSPSSCIFVLMCWSAASKAKRRGNFFIVHTQHIGSIPILLTSQKKRGARASGVPEAKVYSDGSMCRRGVTRLEITSIVPLYYSHIILLPPCIRNMTVNRNTRAVTLQRRPRTVRRVSRPHIGSGRWIPDF